MLAPAQIIIRGPSATFGKLFNIVKNGSNTLAKNLLNQSILATNKPITLPSIKLIIISIINSIGNLLKSIWLSSLYKFSLSLLVLILSIIIIIIYNFN